MTSTTHAVVQDSISLKIGIDEGSPYRELAALIAECYRHFLKRCPEFRDGQSNCWVVAAFALGLAEALHLKARMCKGRVRDTATGEFCFGGGLHYWVELHDGTIIDGPAHDALLITGPEERRSINKQYIEHRAKLARDMRGLVDTARLWGRENIKIVRLYSGMVGTA